MTYYAGDEDVEVILGPLATGDVDGTTIDSARVMAVPPRGGAAIELAVTIATQSTTAITLRHLTTGSLTPSGRWTLRAYYYDGAALVLSSTEAALTVTTRTVPTPS